MNIDKSKSCDHQWTDYGTLSQGDNPKIEIESCVRCGVQRKKEKMNIDVDDAFEHYMRTVNPTVDTASVQYRECRRCFIAGMFLAFQWLQVISNTHTEDQAVEMLEQLKKQFFEFRDRVKQEKD